MGGRRLNIERQKKLEPSRMETAKSEINKLGYQIIYENETQIVFMFKNEKITYFPYSGWASGKTIKDGRGLRKLLNQINPTIKQ